MYSLICIKITTWNPRLLFNDLSLSLKIHTLCGKRDISQPILPHTKHTRDSLCLYCSTASGFTHVYASRTDVINLHVLCCCGARLDQLYGHENFKQNLTYWKWKLITCKWKCYKTIHKINISLKVSIFRRFSRYENPNSETKPILKYPKPKTYKS